MDARLGLDPALYAPARLARTDPERLVSSHLALVRKIAWHVPCHQRVQNIGPKTREVFQLIPDTTVETIERCSGHDGTYAIKRESHEFAVKIGRPVMSKVNESGCDHYTSDCPMAADHISTGVTSGKEPESPFTLIRAAYGI